MGKVARTLSLLFCLSSSVWVVAQGMQSSPVSASASPARVSPATVSPATVAQAIIPLSQIHEGMKGTALTVFQGVKPESMDVEVLGVMRNVNGPKGDIILVRLHGTKPEYTGVVAGMSGSPVYFDGKLAGALAFRIGEFSKEPIAGVTPIEEMLEIDALDRRPAPASLRAGVSDADSSSRDYSPSGVTRTSSPGENSALQGQKKSDYQKGTAHVLTTDT